MIRENESKFVFCVRKMNKNAGNQESCENFLGESLQEVTKFIVKLI
jgi:hypothetical protein